MVHLDVSFRCTSKQCKTENMSEGTKSQRSATSQPAKALDQGMLKQVAEQGARVRRDLQERAARMTVLSKEAAQARIK